ncbi:unnamed protein product [Miscanthus lutarioriparius]|uniref:Uncharacterized protein n=1 Tax=Miscanthus lutarioriparius TaxID=422564 RepID=A0A811MMK0_9POAL|nr:unnamed protein product [Miscanthus lutarioriparius]
MPAPPQHTRPSPPPTAAPLLSRTTLPPPISDLRARPPATHAARPPPGDLLQLPPGEPTLRGVLDRIFVHWLSLPDTAALGRTCTEGQGEQRWGGGVRDAAPDDAAGGAAVLPLSPRFGWEGKSSGTLELLEKGNVTPDCTWKGRWGLQLRGRFCSQISMLTRYCSCNLKFRAVVMFHADSVHIQIQIVFMQSHI